MKTMREQALDVLHDRGIAELERHAEVSRRHRCDCGRCFCCEADKLAREYRLAEHYEAATRNGS